MIFSPTRFSVTSAENLRSNQAISRRVSARAIGSLPIRVGSGWTSSRYSEITQASVSVAPSGSISTGTSPAGLRVRNSSRRSHTFSTFNSTSSAFSARAMRMIRQGADNQR